MTYILYSCGEGRHEANNFVCSETFYFSVELTRIYCLRQATADEQNNGKLGLTSQDSSQDFGRGIFRV